MEVEIRSEMLGTHSIHLRCVVLRDVGVTEVRADDGFVVSFGERVVVAGAWPRTRKFVFEFVEQLGHHAIDVFATVVGMKSP